MSRLNLFKQRLHRELISNLDLASAAALNQDDLRRAVRQGAEDLCNASTEPLNLAEREKVVTEVVNEAFGLGPLEPLMQDPTVTDVLINGPRTVYVERGGRLELTNVRFCDDRHLLQTVQRIVGKMGRRVDEANPMVDARLPDGSRINALIPPLALDGPLVSIRRFGSRPLKAADLVARGAVPQEVLDFLGACVRARLNLIISGGTGSGKTTLLNALSAFIPPAERVVTIEDAAELKLQQPHLARMETRPANIEGRGAVTTRDLVRNALRMRPDRIVVGECRGPEALDMLQAMNTGHEGSMTTLHANDTRDAVSRLEMLIGMAGFDLPIWIIRRQIASAVQIVVQVARLPGGARKVIKVSEITGMEGDVISMHDLFGFSQTGVDDDHNARGYFYAAGIRPRCLDRLAAAGERLCDGMFERQTFGAGET